MPKSHVSSFDPGAFQEKILDWYAKHQRVLPWRARGRGRSDPYKVWLSEIMLQQTTVSAVIPYFLRFTEKWPDVHSLAKAEDSEVMKEWAGLGYYARARNLLKCARIVSHETDGVFPENVKGLMDLPGIGPYTAAAISCISYGKNETVVDGNIERVTARVFRVPEALPLGKKEIRLAADSLFLGMEKRGGKKVSEFPQALMDLGAGICTVKGPKCNLCPVSTFCLSFKAGDPEKYPVRAPKKASPVRRGRVYLIHDGDGRVVFQKRPETRMLGGMMGLPTTDWDIPKDDFDNIHIPLVKKMGGLTRVGIVYHVFTHFKLELEVWRLTVPDVQDVLGLGDGFCFRYVPEYQFNKIGLPTVFLKAAKIALKGLEPA